MEFLPSEIARLVLGYLEDEKCDSAYETFLTTSTNLVECLKMREMGKKFRTQVIGLSLSDILHEYSAIYCSVHERLKKIDPETAESLRNSGSLLDKLTFLLNANSSGQTMLFSITLPHGKSPSQSAVAHVRKRFKSSGIDRTKDRLRKTRMQSENDSVCDELNDSRVNQSDVDTTPLCSLPGNNNVNKNVEESGTNRTEGDGISRTPRRKCATSVRKTRTGTNVTDGLEENLDFSMLTKVLIDNHELHEKLAENINRVIGTPEIEPTAGTSVNNTSTPLSQNLASVEAGGSVKPSDTCNTGSLYSSSFCTELDNAIKKIVQDTESDPVFENILFDVIAPLTEETSDDCEDRGISSSSTPQKAMSDQNNEGSNSSDQGDVNKTVISAKSVRQTKPKQSVADMNAHPNIPCKIIEDQNADAIKSIIAVNSKLSEQQQEVIKPSQENMNVQTNICNSVVTTSVTTTAVTTVASFTNSLSSTVETNSLLTKTNENPTLKQHQGYVIGQTNPNIVVISNGTSSMVNQPTFVLASTGTNFPSMENQLVFVGGKGHVGTQQYLLQPQQPQYQTTTLLTEKDIMAMPTVIMYGEDRKSCNTFPLSTHSIFSPMSQICQPKPQNSILNILPKNPEPEKPIPQLSITLYAGDEKTSQDGKIQSSGSNLHLTISPLKPGKSVPMILNDSEVKDPIETPKIVTPPKVNAEPRQSMSTPRSGKSHIRALDFSTPPKDGISTRKANTSPKSSKISSIRKSPKRKGLRTSLFSSTNQPFRMGPLKFPNNVPPVATRTPSVKLSGDWDNVQGTGLILGNSSQILITTPNENDENSAKNKNRKKGTCWDEDLRALFSPEVAKVVSPKRVRKNVIRATPKRKIKKKTEELNKTAEEVIKIEAALNSSNEPKETDKKEEKTPSDKVETKRKAEKKKVIRKPKKKSVTKVKVEMKEIKKEIKEEVQKPVEVINELKIVPRVEIEYITVEKPKPNLRNMRPRLKKKCNMGNAPRKILTKSPTVIQKSQPDVSKNMKVFSPSKYNANKRTLVEPEAPKPDLVPEIPQISIVESETVQNIAKITPTMLKISEENTVTFQKNLTPMLETPMKFDSSLLPVTPKIFTPFSSSETPFSKILKENMGSVDFSMIPTPSFPLTPSFPNLTPNSQNDGEGYNRPTDYSTSSSYYQPSPSDGDHKLVLDLVLIEESKSMDKKLNGKDGKSNGRSSLESCASRDTYELNRTQDCVLNELSLMSPIKPRPISIGKNLDIIEKDTNISIVGSENTDDSKYSCCSSDCSSSTDSADETISKTESNITMIEVAKESPNTSTERYPLRSRQTPSKELDNKSTIIQKIVEPIRISIPKKKIIRNKSEDEKNSVLDLSLKENDKIESELQEMDLETNQPSTSQNLQITRPKTKSTVIAKDNLLNAVTNFEPNITVPKKEEVKFKETDLLSLPSTSKGIRSSTRPKTKSTVISNDHKIETISNIESKILGTKTNEVKIKDTEILSVPSTSQSIRNTRQNTTVISNNHKTEPMSLNAAWNLESKMSVTKKEEVKLKETDIFSLPSTSQGIRIARPKMKSTITSSILESLAEKRKRVINAIKDAKPDPDIVTKTEKRKKTTIKATKPSSKKNGRKLANLQPKIMQSATPKKNKSRVRKLPDKMGDAKEEVRIQRKSPRKTEGIESIAARLKNQNTELKELSVNLEINDNLDKMQQKTIIINMKDKENMHKECNKIQSKRKSIEMIMDIIKTHDESKVSDGSTDTFKEEDIPRLHLSSDEEEIISHDVKNFINKRVNEIVEESEIKKLKELKDRGIHLIPITQKNDNNKTIDKKVQVHNVVVLNMNEKIDFSKIDTEKGVKIDVISKSNKNSEEKTTKKENIKSSVSKPTNDQKNTSSSRVRNDSTDSYNFSLNDDFFEVVTFTENSPSSFKYIYNESTACKRTLKDYDIETALSRSFSINIYLEEFNVEQDRPLTVTPFTELYSAPSKPRKKWKISPLKLEESKLKRLKLIDSKKISPLKKIDKPDTKISPEDVKIKEKTLTKKQKAQEKKETKAKTISLEQYKLRNESKNINDAQTSSEGKAIDDKIDFIEEDSMDFALTASSKPTSTPEMPVQELNWKKRKLCLDSDVSKQNPEKRNKQDDQRALLKNVDLEKFLTKVHGPSDD